MDVETVGKYHQTLTTLQSASKGECGLEFPSEAVCRWQDLCLMASSVEVAVRARPRYFAVLASLEYLDHSVYLEVLRRELLTILHRSGIPKVGSRSQNPFIVGGTFSRLQQVVFRWGSSFELLIFAGGSSPSASLWSSPPTDTDVYTILTSVQTHFPIVANCGEYDSRRFHSRQGVIESVSSPLSATGLIGIKSGNAFGSRSSYRTGTSRRVATPLWSCSRTLLCARDLSAAVASGESSFLVEQYRISPQSFDTLSGSDAVSSVMKGMPMPLVSASTEPLHFLPFRAIIDALTSLRSGKGGRSSLSFGQASLAGVFPPVLTPDGKHLSAEFTSCYLRHRPLPPSSSEDTMQSPLPQSIRNPQDLSATAADSAALEGALGQLLRFVCKVLHFIHDRFPMTHFYTMLPVLNDALRIMHLLGHNIADIVSVATACGDLHSPPAPLQGPTFDNVGPTTNGAVDGWMDDVVVHPICQLASKAVFFICGCYHRLQDRVRALVEASLLGSYSNGEVLGNTVKSITSDYGDCQSYVDTFALRASQISLARDFDSDDEEGFDADGHARYNRKALRREDATLVLPPEGSGLGVSLIANVLHPLVAFSMILTDPGEAVTSRRRPNHDNGFDVSVTAFASSATTPRVGEASEANIEAQRHRLSSVVVPHCPRARLHIATLLYAQSIIIQELANVVHFRAPTYLNVYHGVAAQLIKGAPDRVARLFESRPNKPQSYINSVQSTKLGEVEWAAIVMSDRRTVERFTDAHPDLHLDIKDMLLQ